MTPAAVPWNPVSLRTANITTNAVLIPKLLQLLALSYCRVYQLLPVASFCASTACCRETDKTEQLVKSAQVSNRVVLMGVWARSTL